MKSEKTNELLQKLMKCIAACENCATHDLEEDNPKMMAQCVQINRDCADICALTAQLISRDSNYADDIIKICAKVCRDCEEECRSHDHDHCQKCADACHECHLACEEYANLPVKEHR